MRGNAAMNRIGLKQVFPAYHMNKNNWITLALDGSVDDSKTELLLDMSYEATVPKIKRRKC